MPGVELRNGRRFFDVDWNVITPGYFRTLGIPILQGRDVRDADHLDGPPVAIVSASFVTQFLPGQEALGRRFNFAAANREIVGVVADVKMRGLTRVSEPQVYIPHRQLPDRTYEWFAPKDLAVRATGDPLALVSAVRAIVQRADAEVPLSDIQTLEQLVDGDLASRVTQLRVLGAFAGVALACVLRAPETIDRPLHADSRRASGLRS